MRSRALLAAVALILLAPEVRAEPVPSLDLRNFHAPNDPASGVYVQPADTGDTGEWNVGLWFSYAYRPITLRDAATDKIAFNVLSHQLTSDVVGSFALFHRLQLGFDLPVLLYQSGDAPTAAATRAAGDYTVPAQAFGDLGLTAKVTIVRPTAGDLGGFALAFHERFTVPTGDPSSFLGEGAVTSESRLLGEYRFPMIGVHGALGFKLRGQVDSFACGAVGEADCPSRFGHEIPFGLGVSFIPKAIGIDDKGVMTWFVEMTGHLPASPRAPGQSAAASSAQIGAAARFQLGGDVSLLAGVQTALIGGVGDAPFRGLLSLSWAPRAHDKDADGILDDVDQCPELAEDRDGYQDADGCPDGDNDGDGVPDAADKCPNTKEDADGYQDADGCPDPDNDQDKIPDAEDACPDEPGSPDPDPKKNGCPVRDRDGDGIPDGADACPDAPGPANQDPRLHGCPPDHDADGDGVPDAADACPAVKGVRSPIAAENGCPDLDPDKDTYAGDEDKCPNEPETWNGYKDDDGCPDEAKKAPPVVVVKEKKGAAPAVEVAKAIRFTAANEVDPASLFTLRALASEMVKRPGWIVRVGVRRSPKEDESVAAARAQAIVSALRRFTRNQVSTQVADWDGVKAAPRAAEHGVGFAISVPGAAVIKPSGKPVAPKPKAPAPGAAKR